MDMTLREVFQRAWGFVRRWLLAPLPALLLIAGAGILFLLGAKNIQIGGLLGKLFGKKVVASDPKVAVQVANSVPDKRIDANGNLLPLDTPDSTGQSQAKVVPIQEPKLFGDPSKVTILPSDGDPVEVDLPDGVRAKDVDKVILAEPSNLIVTVKDTSGISASAVDDLLTKYR